jgi:hypothetical protein
LADARDFIHSEMDFAAVLEITKLVTCLMISDARILVEVFLLGMIEEHPFKLTLNLVSFI